jgi:hypothetical protein
MEGVVNSQGMKCLLAAGAFTLKLLPRATDFSGFLEIRRVKEKIAHFLR